MSMKNWMFLRSQLHRILIASVVCMLLIFGGINLILPSSASAETPAYVRVIHASPFVGTADVFVDGKPLLSSFQFASVTDYAAIPSGAHNVQISLVGKGINASIINKDLTVAPGTVYTVAAIGATADTLGLQVFSDDNQVVANRAKVRVYSLSPDSESINVDVGGDDKLNDVSYLTASTYVTTDTGPCTMVVANPHSETSLSPLTLNLNANTVTSLFTVGLYKGSPKIQLVSAQAQGLPGMPQTGSDPATPDAVNAQPIWPFFLPVVAVILLLFGMKHTRKVKSF